MRGFLVALQTISQAIVDEDTATAVKAARQVGAATQQEVPASLVGKLPLEFKQLGFDTHTRFDQLALNMEQFGDTSEALPELATLMGNCTACHAVYRFDLEHP
jgi:cytochrome c556